MPSWNKLQTPSTGAKRDSKKATVVAEDPIGTSGEPPSDEAIAAEAATRIAAMKGGPHKDCSDEESSDVPPRGAGWWGFGPPMQIGAADKVRDYVDGGGLCSPGRWPPHQRRLPTNSILARLGEKMAKTFAEEEAAGHDSAALILSKLACGKAKECPFRPEATSALRGWAEAELTKAGIAWEDREGDREQPIRMRLFGALLQEAGDPDWAVFGDTFASGVPVGWGRKLPRTPAVFDRKVKWALDIKEVRLEDFSVSEDALSASGAFRANYKPATRRRRC